MSVTNAGEWLQNTLMMARLTMAMSCPVEQASKDAQPLALTMGSLFGLNVWEIQEKPGEPSLWLLTSREKESIAEWTATELACMKVTL